MRNIAGSDGARKVLTSFNERDAAPAAAAGAAVFVELTGAANPFAGVNLGAGQFAYPALIDADRDGDLDLVVGNQAGTLAFYRNNAGVYSAATGGSNPFNGLDVGNDSTPVAIDFDGDGDLDLILGSQGGSLIRLRNDGPSNFTNLGAFPGLNGGAFSAPAAFDADSDGDLDLVVGESEGTFRFFRNDGGGNFTSLTGAANPFNGISVRPAGDNTGVFARPAFADLDNDGDRDLLASNVYGTIFVFTNNGGTYSQSSNNPFSGFSFTVAPAFLFHDVDGDGDADAIVGTQGGTIRYFRNETVSQPSSVPTAGDDVLTDTPGADTINALGGNDRITVTNGNDNVNGGSGTDTLIVNYASATAAVFNGGQNAPGASANGGFFGSFGFSGRTVTFNEVERFVIITGSGNDNVTTAGGDDGIDSGAGNDSLNGGGGADTLNGGAGDDSIDGGDGLDTAVFGSARSNYAIVNLGGGRVRVTGPEGTDVLTGVERLQFGNQTFSVPTGVFEQTLYQAANNFGAGPAGGGWASYGDFPRVVGDINGDGRADIIGFGAAGTYVSLGQANGTFGAVTQVNAEFGQSNAGGGWASYDRFPRMVADVNGDGRADIVGFGDAGTYVALANGSGGFGALSLAVSNFGTTAGGWSSQNLYHRTMGDVNGDGRADIIGFGEAGTYVALGAANGSFAAPTLAVAQFGRGGEAGGWTSHDLYARMVGDINNDGRADLIGFGGAGTYVALGNANGTFGSLTLALGEFGTATGWSSQDRYPRMIADVNGDGFDDIIGFGEAGVYYALNNGAGGFGTVALGYAQYGNGAGGWASSNRYPRLLGDVNGDGLADIIGFGENGVFVTLADGFDVVAAQDPAGAEPLAGESGDAGTLGDVALVGLFPPEGDAFVPFEGGGSSGLMSAFLPEGGAGEGQPLIFEEFGGQLHVLNEGALEDLSGGATFIV